MSQEIVIEISATGDVQVGAKGVKGPDCEKLTAEIEDALGAVTKRTRTHEYHEARTIKRKAGA